MSMSNHTFRSRNTRTQTDVPPPLQIVKRPDSGWSQKSRSSRRYSSESASSDASVRSAPEPPGGDFPLSVPKRRGNNSAATTPRSIPAARARPRRSAANTDPLDTETETVVQQQQRQLSDRQHVPLCAPWRRPFGVTPQASVRRRAQPSPDPYVSAQGYARLDYSQLRNSKSMLHLTASPSQNYSSIAEEPIAPSDSYSSCDSFQERSVSGSPRILVPQIVVTPGTKVLDDGINDLWAAVQLSAEARWVDPTYRPPNDDDSRASQPDDFQHGCLYDVSIEVLPTVHSKVVEVLDDRTSSAKTTLYPGSRLLILAHVQLSSPVMLGYRTRRHVRQSSDDLIQDLEHALGTTTTEYLHIRITYRHSGFPTQAPAPDSVPGDSESNPASSTDTMSIDTKLETVARATIKRYNSASPWSMQPAQLENPPLYEIIAAHWGADSARQIMHRITSHSRPLPPLPRNPHPFTHGRRTPTPTIAERISEETVRSPDHLPAPPPTRAPPSIPKRQTSLNRTSIPQYDGIKAPQDQEAPNTFSSDSASSIEDYDSETDPARKIWTQMRRASITSSDSGGTPTYHLTRVKKVQSSTTMIPQPTPSSTQREVAVAVRRLPQDEEAAEIATPSRKFGSVSTMRGRGSRADVIGRGADGQTARMLRGATSMANLRGDGVGGVGPAGFAVGMGLGAGGRLMAGAEGGLSTRSYGNGNTGAKGGKKERDVGNGKWGWSGWWQS
ncbi:hypothetical protein QBC34DRAFT_81525 [Podospora aff. communis PSN243]|uniref:Uncharacterized protein n=1 Tax=Podospora aff. communis PSN243 TaxID=3040156 RepID=A0AAV9GQ37_9PEZI|nr:hypothetical protein QBC34DRAFT_81525 [Podospora aff. communis PSN243]